MERIELLGVNVSRINYEDFLRFVSDAISKDEKITIGYANADTLNKSCSDESLKKILNSLDIVHPDGIGAYLASRILYGKKGLVERITGSDFYELLAKESVKKKWKFFFFGHSTEILESVRRNNPNLSIAGTNEGYHFSDDVVIDKINKSGADVLIIGLSCPTQEKWINENSADVNCKVILAVGDGIKVFAGEKVRGPVFLRRLGFEWASRLVSNPSGNFRKYVIGIPVFGFRVMKSLVKLKLK